MTTENQEQDQLQQYPDSVLERGFGVVGKIVMQDIRISVTAKAIYAYICTFGNVSYPGRDKICHDLQINKGTYSKHLKALVIYGYLSIQQERGKKNMFQHNVYIVNTVPKPCIESPWTKKPYTVESPINSPCTKKPYTVKPDTEKPCTVKPDNNNTTTLKKQVINNTTTKDVVVAILIEYGASLAIANQLIDKYGIEAVAKRIDEVHHKTGIKNAIGWIRSALRENYSETEPKRKLPAATHTVISKNCRYVPLTEESQAFAERIRNQLQKERMNTNADSTNSATKH